MSELSDLIAGDFATISADVPWTGVWRGTSYTGTRTTITKKNAENSAGFIVDYDFKWFVLASLFTTFPQLGDKVTDAATGLVYRVERSLPDPTGNVMVYDMMSIAL